MADLQAPGVCEEWPGLLQRSLEAGYDLGDSGLRMDLPAVSKQVRRFVAAGMAPVPLAIVRRQRADALQRGVAARQFGGDSDLRRHLSELQEHIRPAVAAGLAPADSAIVRPERSGP